MLLQSTERQPVEVPFYVRCEDFGLETFRRAEDAADMIAHYMKFLGYEDVEFGAYGEGRVKLDREAQLKREIVKRFGP
jgi:hypothetical protein